jgi:hypothetical protein
VKGVHPWHGAALNIHGCRKTPFISEYLQQLPSDAQDNPVAFRASLTNVTIGSKVASIWNNAFYYCCNPTNVTTSDSVSNIGSQTFHGHG